MFLFSLPYEHPLIQRLNQNHDDLSLKETAEYYTSVFDNLMEQDLKDNEMSLVTLLKNKMKCDERVVNINSLRNIRQMIYDHDSIQSRLEDLKHGCELKLDHHARIQILFAKQATTLRIKKHERESILSKSTTDIEAYMIALHKTDRNSTFNVVAPDQEPSILSDNLVTPQDDTPPNYRPKLDTEPVKDQSSSSENKQQQQNENQQTHHRTSYIKRIELAPGLRLECDQGAPSITDSQTILSSAKKFLEAAYEIEDAAFSAKELASLIKKHQGNT